MNSYKLVIAPLAKYDLKHIYDYGVNNWGARQASAYLDKLKDHFWGLTEQPKWGLSAKSYCPTCAAFQLTAMSYSTGYSNLR